MEQESVKKETVQEEDIQVLTAGTGSTKVKKELEHPIVDENLNLKPKVEEQEEVKILSSTDKKKQPVKKEMEEPIIIEVEPSAERIKMDKPPEMIKAEKLPEMITIKEDKVTEKVVKQEVKKEVKKQVPVIVLDEEKERVKMETKQPKEEEEMMVVDEEKEKEEELILEKEVLAPPTKKFKVEESPEKKVTFDIPSVQEEKVEKPEEKETEQQQKQPSEVEMMETMEKTPEVTKTLEETKKVDENLNPEETPKRKVQKRKTILKPTTATPTVPARDLRNRSEIHKPDVFQPEPLKTQKKRRSSVSKGKKLQQATPESQGQALSLKTLPQVASSALNGLTFVVSGTLPSFHRDTVVDFITKHGGRVTQGVSKKTNFMLVGHDPGEKKMAQARTLHKACLSEDEFLDLCRQLDVPQAEAFKPQAA